MTNDKSHMTNFCSPSVAVRRLPMRVNLAPGCLRPGGTDRA